MQDSTKRIAALDAVLRIVELQSAVQQYFALQSETVLRTETTPLAKTKKADC